ncbi:spore coat U domain-containing protein [Stenotrophomonas sp. SY1]|uniref:Csu type fimbrial protein n=1 Tax=Stenotrophomonas sp. SY1 TaxID=477235 RepID=UPI001E32CC7B|nr:spore coat U domain-containing protein [Stenotrophomonas sp. SY1]MCD9086990.1 spore coat U domain-containing protein [Stenotrophomonas sp. SY1]
MNQTLDLHVRRTTATSATVCRWLLCLSLLVLFWMPFSTRAQDPTGTCWVNGSATLDFGRIGAGAEASTNSTMQFGCSVTPLTPAVDVTVRLCVFIESDPTVPGVLPRRMRGDQHQQVLQYDLYYDAAHQHPIGQAGTNLPIDSWTMTVPASANGSPVMGDFPIHAKVHGGQASVMADRYQTHPAGSTFRYIFSTNATIPVLACESPLAQSADLAFGGVYAEIGESCHIMTATNMDFGQVRSLTGGLEQVSQISLTCPVGMAWQVGLDNGANADGQTRRMAAPNGNFINYELYRDAARQQRWGNTPDSDTSAGTGQGSTVVTLDVYGRVPDQPTSAGTYEDTVTVTLTF